jgi:hypothetical protein
MILHTIKEKILENIMLNKVGIWILDQFGIGMVPNG